jgi:hypothetical protein
VNDLRAILETLDPTARDERGDDWADIIDFLTMYPDAWRRLVGLLA